MGRPGFLHSCLIALVAAAAACGGSEDDLLVAGDLEAVYSGGSGGGGYGPAGSGTGTIEGRVIFKGRPFGTRPWDVTTVDGFCLNYHPKGLANETFLLGRDGGLANVIVYVEKGLNSGKWPVPKEPLVLDQVECQYHPHVAVLQIGRKLIVKSSDTTNHNVHMARGPNGELNRSMTRPGALAPMTMRKAEMARRIWCDVHGWMESWLAILPHPFHAISGADGTFRIENVPAGKYLLGAWHEKKLSIEAKEIVVKDGETVTHEFVIERK